MPPTAQPKHLFRIKSLHEAEPSLPEVLEGFHLHRPIEAGSPISLDDLYQARSIVSAFESSPLFLDHLLITPAVIESARFRVLVIESAHASALFGPADLWNAVAHLEASRGELQALQDELQARMEEQDLMSYIMDAKTANWRILARNGNPSRLTMQMLQKTVPGHGLALALAAAHTPAAHDALAVPALVPDVGAVPPGPPFNPANASHEDVLQLIVFYGENFGILPGEELGAQVEKVCEYMGCA